MAVTRGPSARSGRLAWLVFGIVFLIYNSNGREVGTYDSQPTKLAARALVLEGTLTLDREVALAPGLGVRSGFQHDLAGHFRSAYSPVPSLLAAVPAWLLRATRLVDLDAPLASNLIAALTASLLASAAIALVFLAVARNASRGVALLVAGGLGLGSNVWTLASRTLWGHETVIFGLALTLCAWLRPRDRLHPRDLWLGALGLALAGATRPQVTPVVVILLAGLISRVGVKRAWGPVLAVVVAGGAMALMQWFWFGHPLGGLPRLQVDHPSVHGVPGSISSAPWIGALGLLVSPSRGLLVFSPVVIVALIGAPIGWRRSTACGERWFLGAAIAQFAAYSCFSVWWGGHTFGPRYLLDILVLLVPAAIAGAGWMAAARWRQGVGTVVLAWSVLVAATGAFSYPNDQWNSDPADIDTNHERLWDWRDSQIVRCWQRGPSPQNFSLFDRAAVRRTP
jgi:hypothetical protein